MLTIVVCLLALAVSVWIFIDARRLEARKGGLGGGLLDMGPLGWFFSSLVFWIVSVPCYLVVRRRLVDASRARAGRPRFVAPARNGGSVVIVALVVGAILAEFGWRMYTTHPRTIAGIPSAVVSSTGATVVDPPETAGLARVALHNSDFRTGYTLRLSPGGDQVAGQVTLDNCGYTFNSEQHRVARQQYTLFDPHGNRMGLSNELVAYDTAFDAASALVQWRIATAHCPRGLVHSTIAGTPPLRERVTHNASRVRSLPNANNVVTVESLAARGTGTRWVIVVLQIHGPILDAVYLTTTSRPTSDEIATATKLVSITGRRLATT